jgi:hypothetical protein
MLAASVELTAVFLNSSSCGDGLAIAVMLPGDSLHLVYFLFFRSVLTRAELEALPLDNHLKEDVARGKVGLIIHRQSVSTSSSIPNHSQTIQTNHQIWQIVSTTKLLDQNQDSVV